MGTNCCSPEDKEKKVCAEGDECCKDGKCEDGSEGTCCKEGEEKKEGDESCCCCSEEA